MFPRKVVYHLYNFPLIWKITEWKNVYGVFCFLFMFVLWQRYQLYYSPQKISQRQAFRTHCPAKVLYHPYLLSRIEAQETFPLIFPGNETNNGPFLVFFRTSFGTCFKHRCFFSSFSCRVYLWVKCSSLRRVRETGYSYFYYLSYNWPSAGKSLSYCIFCLAKAFSNPFPMTGQCFLRHHSCDGL